MLELESEVLLMKKIILSVITLVSLFLNVNTLVVESEEAQLHHPEETTVTENDMVKVSALIDDYIYTYTTKFKVSWPEELPGNVAQKMYDEIDKLKSEYFDEIPTDELPTPRSASDRSGAIYATANSKTVVYHGHASMSINAAGTTHIEANPGNKTKYYYNRLTAYWNSNPHTVYKVRGKNQATHNYVASRAGRYLGINYNAGNYNGINCASLVKNIWMNEGGLYNNGGITVGSLANHGGLYKVYNHRGGYGAKS